MSYPLGLSSVSAAGGDSEEGETNQNRLTQGPRESQEGGKNGNGSEGRPGHLQD